MSKLTDAERVYLEALRTVRASLMDTITGLDDTIAEIEQAAAAREQANLRCSCSPKILPPHTKGVPPTCRYYANARVVLTKEDRTLAATKIPGFVRELSDGGYQYRNQAGRLVNVAANGFRSYPVQDNPQA